MITQNNILYYLNRIDNKNINIAYLFVQVAKLVTKIINWGILVDWSNSHLKFTCLENPLGREYEIFSANHNTFSFTLPS